MAATAGSSAASGFVSEFLNTGPGKFWSADVNVESTCAGFWEQDPEVKIKAQVNALKRKFHSGRYLHIKYLPRDVTEQDVKELLADLPVASVELQTGPGSGSAKVTLEDPEMLEDWEKDRVFMLRGQRVPVLPAPTEMTLCVARLPPTFTEPQFEALVRSYGEVRRSFLMISERTGASKGYGFVEYTVKETALQAKGFLDGRLLDGCTLCCDWLDSSHVTFESLHSKCLYIDRLPPNFRDMGEFRKVFSSTVNPPYCQIALQNGCPQDWGLVEFNSAEDAELTMATVSNVQIRGQKIRASFYIPGVRAINLYLKLLNEPVNKGQGALLPDPPAPAVFQQLQNLAKQNPTFAQNLQNILILSQIQNIPPTKGDAVNTKTSSTVSVGPSSSTSTTSTTSAPSVTIPPPIQRGKTPPVPPNPTPRNTSPNVGTDGNSQAALVVLLAAQLQAQMGTNVPPSLLGNPQMLATLQNMLKQGGSPVPSTASPSPVPGQFQQPPLPPADKLTKNGVENSFRTHSKVPLLPSPSAGVSPPPRKINGMEMNGPKPPGNAANYWNGVPAAPILPPNLSPPTLDQILLSKAAMQDKLRFQSPQQGLDMQHNLGLLLNNNPGVTALFGSMPPSAFLSSPFPPPPVQQPPPPLPIPSAETVWGLPPSPPPPMAWVPPIGSPIRPWVPGAFPSMAPGTPIHFTGRPVGLPGSPQSPVTPVGQKRKYNHILPSPEPSPEGNYIGQHSQGIGGHYSDSYFKRKKKF